MKMSEAVLAWNPDSGEVAVLRHPLTDRMVNQFACTFGAGDAVFEKSSTTEKAVLMLATALDSVALDGIDAYAVREALRSIDEISESLPVRGGWFD